MVRYASQLGWDPCWQDCKSHHPLSLFWRRPPFCRCALRLFGCSQEVQCWGGGSRFDVSPCRPSILASERIFLRCLGDYCQTRVQREVRIVVFIIMSSSLHDTHVVLYAIGSCSRGVRSNMSATSCCDFDHTDVNVKRLRAMRNAARGTRDDKNMYTYMSCSYTNK